MLHFLRSPLLIPRCVLVCAAILLFLGSLVGLIALARPMYPIERGTSADFWAQAMAVRLPGARSEPHHGPVVVRDGIVYWAQSGLHGQYPHWIPEAEAMRDFPAAQSEFARRAAANTPGDVETDFAAEAFRRWQADKDAKDPRLDASLQGLSRRMTAAVTEKLQRTHPSHPLPGQYWYEALVLLEDTVEKSRFYWATFTFELLLFLSLILVIVVPLYRRRSLLRVMLAWAVAPFLFFLPHWFGYAVFTRTPWGPTGGILYAQLLWYSRVLLHWFGGVDYCPNACLPPLLSPISQENTAPIAAFYNSPMAGPLLALAYAAILCGFLLLLAFAASSLEQFRLARLSRPGFQILPTERRTPS